MYTLRITNALYASFCEYRSAFEVTLSRPKVVPTLVDSTCKYNKGFLTNYVNGNSEITVALEKNYATVVSTLDRDGDCVLEQYFINHKRPAITANGNYALRREYNSEGHWVTSTYLDSKLYPVNGRSGYASIHHTYNALG